MNTLLLLKLKALNNYIGIQTAFEKENIKKKNDID